MKNVQNGKKLRNAQKMNNGLKMENAQNKVSTGENWDIHGNGGRVWLVQSDSKVSFATQKKKNENT